MKITLSKDRHAQTTFALPYHNHVLRVDGGLVLRF